MFVYTYLCVLKDVQTISKLINLWEIFMFLNQQLGQGSAFFTTCWHIFEKQKSGIKI